MLRHIVLLTLADDAPEGRAAEIAAAITALQGEIPSIRSVEAGPDLGYAPGTSTLGLTMTFDDHAGWQAYQDHPAHKSVIELLIKPVLAGRAAIQFELPA